MAFLRGVGVSVEHRAAQPGAQLPDGLPPAPLDRLGSDVVGGAEALEHHDRLGDCGGLGQVQLAGGQRGGHRRQPL
jgi:hypothetical protein